MGKNKTIPSGERTIILRVLHFFEEEKKLGSPLLPLKKALNRTSTATGVSLSTITRIKKEELKILKERSATTQEPSSEQTTTSALVPRPVVILPTPGKKRGPAYNKLEIDDFTISAIKNIVNDFYKEKNELPTLKKILAVAKADFNFPGQKETLRKILREKCGYTFTKCMKKSNLLRSSNEIGFWRARTPKTKEKKRAKKRAKSTNTDTNYFNSKNEYIQPNTTINEPDKTQNESNDIKNDQTQMQMVQNNRYKDEFSIKDENGILIFPL